MGLLHQGTAPNQEVSSDRTTAYRQPADRVLAALRSDPEHGLTTEEARQRLAQYGPNELQAERRVPGWRTFLAQFQDVLIILLLIAAAISLVVWLYERSEPLPYQALVIFAIVLLNGLSVALQSAEASLTGESLPVSKDAAPLDEEVALGDRADMVFAGTAVTYGRGRTVVTATGMQTEMGQIAGLLHQTRSEQTPLQQQLDRTGKVLGVLVMIIAVVMVVTIILVEGVREFSAIVDVLILAVALAVAAVPEGLPAVVTSVLALGVQRMARRHAIMRKLPAVETLGSATVIASDKTGTLTRNQMTVRAVVTASGRVDVTGTGYGPEGELRVDGRALGDGPQRSEVLRTLGAADRANNAVLHERDGQWTIQGDPTEGALIVAARKAGLTDQEMEQRFARVGEVPFSSERKLMSTVHSDVQRPERLCCATGTGAAHRPWRAGPARRSVLSSPLSSRARRSVPPRRRSTPSARRRRATWPRRRASPCR